MQRPDGLDYRSSLRALMEKGDPVQIEANAGRQERTVDAVLNRFFHTDAGQRRELVLLADEVGLGKTFVALGVAWSMLVQRRAEKLPARPILVVTPSSHALFRKWHREAETFFKDVVPEAQKFDVVPVESPRDLIAAMRVRKPRLILARMSAFDGRLHDYNEAIAATLHGLFRHFKPVLTVEQRLILVEAWPTMNNRDAVDLRKSGTYWNKDEPGDKLNISKRHIKRALRRLSVVDPALIGRIEKSFQLVRRGEKPMTGFPNEVREVARASLAQLVKADLPLVIVDEIHNWKNHPQNWLRFLHTFGGRIERLLGLSATPFQLGSHELTQVLKVRDCLSLTSERKNDLDRTVDELRSYLERADEAGKRLRDAWSEVRGRDVVDIETAWQAQQDNQSSPIALPPRLQRSLTAALDVQAANRQLMGALQPFLVRHRRDVSHRRWSIGRDAAVSSPLASGRPGTLQWRPGLDVVDDAELVHYLMMRAVQEEKHGHGATSLGADFGGSYDFFRGGELRRLQLGNNGSSKPYLDLVEQATRPEGGHEHPKVKVTADRTFDAWRNGEKTLIFCFNLLTVDAVRNAVQQRISSYEAGALSAAFDCSVIELPKRLENFQKRLYNYRQAVFLLFQDHPLAGKSGRVPQGLALRPEDVSAIAHKLALSGTLKERSRFDRRRVLAAVEQVLITRWQQEPAGLQWLENALEFSADKEARAQFVASILAPDWPSRRRNVVEGVRKEAEAEPFADEDDNESANDQVDPADVAAWMEVLAGHAGRAVLAPYLTGEEEIPSLLTRWHASAMQALPTTHRALAARMLRRMVRSPGFLARFLLDDPESRPALATGDDESDTQWTALLHKRWNTPPAGGESAKDRFEAYLETLRKVVGRGEGFAAYEDASRNREVVAKVTGSMHGTERDRHFTGFNTPLVPEVLIVTSVGQEGIDLHRECRHVIHHDLPWNPATLEQRTGRVDRIGSKAERLVTPDNPKGCLDVVVPYIANTYDEYRFRKVHARSHLFEVTMGGDYVVETCRNHNETLAEDKVVDDNNDDDNASEAMVPLPAMIADALRMRLEANADP